MIISRQDIEFELPYDKFKINGVSRVEWVAQINREFKRRCVDNLGFIHNEINNSDARLKFERDFRKQLIELIEGLK